MIRLLAVIERDLKKFRRNPIVIAMSVLMPLVYLLILGNSFQGKLTDLPLAVVSHDPGPWGKRLLENLRAVEAGPRTIRISVLEDEGEALSGVRAGRFKAALVVPPGFSRRVETGDGPEVGLFLDNPDNISAETVRAVLAGTIPWLASRYVPVRESRQAVLVRDVNLYPKVDYYQSLVPGVVIMAIFLGAMTTGAFNLVMDRFLGIDESYLLTPLTRSEIVGGLVASGLVVTTTIASGILAASMAITGIPLAQAAHRFPPLLLVIVLTTLCLQSLMFLLLGRAGHPRIVGILSGFMNVILFFPSGAVYPMASFPGWLRAFARINPEAYAVDAMKAVLFKGAGLHAVTGDLAFLAGFTAVTMTLSVLLFRRTL